MLKMPEPQGDLHPHDPVIGLEELWLRCFALGTMHMAPEVEALLRGEARPSRHEYNIIAVASTSIALNAVRRRFCRWSRMKRSSRRALSDRPRPSCHISGPPWCPVARPA
jgi:hypothetical protein